MAISSSWQDPLWMTDWLIDDDEEEEDNDDVCGDGDVDSDDGYFYYCYYYFIFLYFMHLLHYHYNCHHWRCSHHYEYLRLMTIGILLNYIKLIDSSLVIIMIMILIKEWRWL